MTCPEVSKSPLSVPAAGQVTTVTTRPIATASHKPETPSASARYMGSDITTQGHWKGTYGSDGFAISADPSANEPIYERGEVKRVGAGDSSRIP